MVLTSHHGKRGRERKREETFLFKTRTSVKQTKRVLLTFQGEDKMHTSTGRTWVHSKREILVKDRGRNYRCPFLNFSFPYITIE
jgi:hypothetical protein